MAAPERQVRVVKPAEQAAPQTHCNMQLDGERRRQDFDIRRSALALAATIARKYGLECCPTCGRKAA